MAEMMGYIDGRKAASWVGGIVSANDCNILHACASISVGRLGKSDEQKWKLRVSCHDSRAFSNDMIRSDTDRMIARIGKGGAFGKNAASLMRRARDLAMSSDYDGPHLGCVIAYKGRPIGTGYNTDKTAPVQKIYNLRYRKFTEVDNTPCREHSLHAEMAAILEASKRIKGMSGRPKMIAYVYRIAPGLPYRQGLAKPCGACMHALRDAGVDTVVYSTNDGFAVAYNEQ